MRKAKLFHAGKLLLIVSAVFLARASGYYDSFFRRLPDAGSAQSESVEETQELSATALAAAVRPRTVLVCTRDGVITASAYAGEETEEAFHRFSAILGEALGSAGEPTEIGEQEFRAGIEKGCVFLDLSCGAPLELLAAWLGSEMAGPAASVQTRTLYLGLADTTAQLCYRDGEGRFFRCSTAAVSEALSARMDEFEGSAAGFAYADRTLKNLDPYAIMLTSLPEFPGVAGSAVRDGLDAAQLQQTLGMNSFVASTYIEADGTKVFIEGSKTLRLSPDGTVNYRADAGEGERAFAEGLPAAVSYAYAAALRSIGACAGEADIVFSGVVHDGADSYTVTFDYCIGSVPLRLPAGSAAQFVMKNGRIADARLMLRSYVCTDGTECVLPMRQAAAIAAVSGITPTLAYADSGEQISCVWVRDE